MGFDVGQVFFWWFARLSELIPGRWSGAEARVHAGILVDVHSSHKVTASVFCRHGHSEKISLGTAIRHARRSSVLLRPPVSMVLVKQHTVPTVRRRQLDQMLHYELARITPFRTEELFWRWDGPGRPEDGNRTAVTLTMVPRRALLWELAALSEVGLSVDALIVGSPDSPRLLPIGVRQDRSRGTMLVRGLGWSSACLVVVALASPFVLQAFALRQADIAIAALQPALAEAEALRGGITAENAERDLLTQQTGAVMQILTTLTHALPDDTFLTDLSLHEGQMIFSGRSASAPRLVTALSSDPAIHDVAFAAPVVRVEGATSDIFSIRAGFSDR